MISRILDGHKIKHLSRLLASAKRVVTICHMSPDGDAMGSSLAMWHILQAIGKEAAIITPDCILNNLKVLPGASEAVDAMHYPEFADKLIDEADLIICLDFNEPKRAGRLADKLISASAHKVMIDHHEFPADFCEVTISHPELSSTCYLLFRVLCALELFNFIDRTISECLLAGMMTDTGNFSYNAADPEIYIVVAELMRKGADKDRLYRQLFDTFSANCLRLNGFALSSRMQVFPEYGAALITLTRAELNRYHYTKGDTEGLVNRPLSIPGIVCSAFMREESDYIKVSMRSIGSYPVNKFCADHFGGGGHLNAAGGEFDGTLQEAVDLFIKTIPQYKKQYIDSDTSHKLKAAPKPDDKSCKKTSSSKE